MVSFEERDLERLSSEDFMKLDNCYGPMFTEEELNMNNSKDLMLIKEDSFQLNEETKNIEERKDRIT